MSDTMIPTLVGEARHRHDLRVTRDPDGHLLLVVPGIITLSLNGFLLAHALRDSGFPDVDLLNEVLEEVELVDDDNFYGYLLGPGTIKRLHEVAQVPEEDPLTERPENHNPEVVTNTRARGPHPRISHGWCTCGWRGPERGDTHAAEKDVSAHLRWAVLHDDSEGKHLPMTKSEDEFRDATGALREINDAKLNVHRYLDLSTSFLPETEKEDLATEGAHDGRGREFGDMPRVISHYYGWWVNVPDQESQGEEGETLRRQRWPVLQACIEVARARGCNWINFDADASDYDPDLSFSAAIEDAPSIEADPMQAQRRGQ